ncbi:GGDEF domain-containing protein [Rhodococcus sp. BP-149]|uniref:EAL domain-containing protein n=1 Tax=unclassified Rhodococcus (in: high G+C Gram-positive bacteria) TaxID=192944 RepID=UPI001C9B17E5|nr:MULTISPECIES: bifunctional diguanylate cyclase/phosphodiesterase [unclassified Rhodococcus (in: high G+C Gram-positive bacteria)]MBY6686681.1 GGDEF domain-containing protein [Rhodococcus sp. BP-288]MBY6695543.1 GGDEF domain-containing protein [Rhodococcus sp. BP-188]MBY6700173.1 GGDEF domain-containing protein [Rhodococcus sp. BP-285]MBY6704804.1 GGDEF domain-containing protein [Rhodococcus sp. BP-283]MBY6713298.1 GGDEF domain-containing protein [Rhodococcus sp. BP-160]
MRSQRISPDPVLSFLALTPRPAERSRAVIAGITVLVGVAGLLLLPSDALRPGGAVWILLFSATTVPVAVAWFTTTRPRHFETAYVVYSDVGVLTVVTMYDSAFLSMPACAVLVLVSLFAAAFTDTRTLILHVAFSCGLLVVLAAVSVEQGTEIWLVLSRTLALMSMFATPFVIRMYVSYLRRQVEASQRDPLTGLLTRRGLYNRVTSQSQSVQSRRTALGVFVEIADFADVEQRFGRGSGREVLEEIAERLTTEAPADAVAARLSTSQFLCVLLVGPDGSADRAMRDLATGLESTPLRSAPVTVLTGSVAETVDPHADVGTTLHHLMTRAEATMQRRHASRASASADLRDRIAALIASGGPSIVFQPVCTTDTGAVVGYEALSRFPDGYGSPQTWFTDASTVGLRVDLELSAIHAAITASSVLPSGAFVAVNTSADTILSSDLAADLIGRGDRGRRWIVEVTEHDRIDDYDGMGVAVEMLRSAGVLISVDDVGTGYSGLRQLVELRPGVVKLDASIVRGIDTDPMRRAAAVSIVTFSREIGAVCIFEGVETAEELATAREVGADLVQGYLLGRPAPASELLVRDTPHPTS